jgi:NAD(P)-dependent dehydrogenase (short-subunit alcohol dehydrogenase family)
MVPIAKKTVVVTGASSGIGRSSVARLIKSGWRVFATVRKSQDAGSLQAEFGAELIPAIMDVTDRASIRTAAEQVLSQVRGGRLDGLVNVAGVGMVRPVDAITVGDLQEIFNVNVFGQIAVTQALLPSIRRARGRIVNIGSVGVHLAMPFGGLLNASKSAFTSFSNSLRLEMRPFGVRVSIVEPGAIRTPAVEKTLGNIEAMVRNLPADAAARYGEMLRTFASLGYKHEMNGSSPDVVAQAVHHALTASRPKTRYIVGKHARLLVTLPRVLPEPALDVMLLRLLGLPTKFGAVAPVENQQVKRRAA